MRPPGIAPVEETSLFISYASPDEDWARSLHEECEHLGIPSWFAPRGIPGGEWEWAAHIDEAIRGCSVFVLLYSGAAGRSTWVPKEVIRASEERRRVVLVRLDRSPLADGLRVPLADCQGRWIDGFQRDRDEVLQEILKQVRNPDAGIRLPPPPPRPLRLCVEVGSLLFVLLSSSLGLFYGMDADLFLSRERCGLFFLVLSLLSVGLYELVRRWWRSQVRPPWRWTILVYSITGLALWLLGGFHDEVVQEWGPTTREVANLAGIRLHLPPREKNKEDVAGSNDEESSTGDPLEKYILAQLTPETIHRIEGPLVIQRSENTFSARVLVPPLPWLSQETQDFVRVRGGIPDALRWDGIVFVQVQLEREAEALRRTRHRFLLLALTFLLSLGVAHGFLVTSLRRALQHR